jgi:hypothetical protein
MTKLRMIVEIEYETDPAHYPDGSTPKQMAELDAKNAADDPGIVAELVCAGRAVSVRGEAA